ncbi:hypothetical protein EDD85DRAFT_952368 [Armillaria nabsnona]|nr:hypothetical protein EDD85DRAFT_952368 [Armillaria nabsnona]
MATQTDIPSDLTDDDKVSFFQLLDAQLNSTILYTLLHGIYTGILAVTLWNIFINKCWPIRRALVVVIIFLHALITINVAANWAFVQSAFIENRKSFWTVYLKLASADQATYWEMGITASMSTILTDLYVIWCCWMVWRQCWLVVLLPILSLVCAIGSRILVTYYDQANAPVSTLDIFHMVYMSFVLATTLSCTSLIIYRISTVAGARLGAEGRLRVYYCFIEVLLESAALYSITLILYLALTICDSWGEVYLDAVAGIVKGIAPTLLVGRVAAGHTRPKDDCDESAMSTLRFQTPSELSTTSFS